MRKSMTAIVTAMAIAAAVIAQPKPAEARCWGCWVGPGVAAGLIGGAVIAGWSHAYIGGPYYPPYFAYGYGYAPYGYFEPTYYVPPPGYYAPPPPVYVQRVYVHHYYHHYRHHYYY
jgi:hypothetical protein